MFNLYYRRGQRLKKFTLEKIQSSVIQTPQVPFFAPLFYPDPDYPMDSYRISKPHGLSPMVTISAIYPLFPTPQKSHDLIFTNSPGMHDFCQ